MVRTNPVTGWKSLFAVGNHVLKINDVTADESRRLQDWFLQMIVEEHDAQLRHRWENDFDVGESIIRTPFHPLLGTPKLIVCSEKPYGTIERSTIPQFSTMQVLVSELVTALWVSVSSRIWMETV